MSIISRVFGLQLWNLAVTNFDMLFLVISLVDEIQFMLISSRHICIRSIELEHCDHQNKGNGERTKLEVTERWASE